MLPGPSSKKRRICNKYTETEFEDVLALLADNKNKEDYWSDSENDDWPKEDKDNKYHYDPTIEVPTEPRNVINLQQPEEDTNKQQPPRPIKRSRPSGNVIVTPIEQLNYAISSVTNKLRCRKPRSRSLGGSTRKSIPKRKTKRKTKRNTK